MLYVAAPLLAASCRLCWDWQMDRFAVAVACDRRGRRAADIMRVMAVSVWALGVGEGGGGGGGGDDCKWKIIWSLVVVDVEAVVW